MKKVTDEMVRKWIGDGGYKEALSILKQIANSWNDKTPWTPSILNNDINSTSEYNNKGETE
tara:strand:- start:1066 stop:1248 length:183 start_codon:yes stop_codon:yes gene_type:complete